MRSEVAGVAGAVLFAVGCAQPAPPPGGDPDRSPPEPVRISPEPMSVVAPWDGDVVIRFDERLSEQGLANVLLVSPETGRPSLGRGGWGSELNVSLDGGWRADRVYRVVLRPGLRDRFRNVREEPIEIVFSTGPPIPSTALAGLVTDRLTGEPLREARVEARTMNDTIPYVALSDSVGGFVLPHVPPGDYRIRAYPDGNRTGTLEPFEARDSASAAIAADGDTARVRLATLMPDSTPARMARAEPIDSLRVRLVFDDAFDPEHPPGEPRTRVWRLADSTAVPVAEVIHVHAYEQRRAAREAAADSAAAEAAVDSADAAAPDKLAGADNGGADAAAANRPVDEPRRLDRAVGDPLALDTLAADSAAAPLAADTTDAEVLPSRELVLIVERPFEPSIEYVVEISGLTNISGVPDGGGMARFEAPEPPPPPDTTTAPPADSAGTVPADTTGAASPDTTGSAPTDTAAAAAVDSTRARSDTIGVDGPDALIDLHRRLRRPG